MSNNPQIRVIKEKLQAFRRKYYLNKVIRGLVILTLLTTTLFITFALGEGLWWFSAPVRTVLFSLLATLGGLVLVFMVGIPGFKYLNLSKTMTDEAAAKLIGQHFRDVDDKLLNLLQLSQLQDQDNDLLIAAIETRTAYFKPIPFTNAVSFKPNWRLARYIFIPVTVAILVFLVNPDLITRGSTRLVRFREHFPPPPPFTIKVTDHVPALVDGASHTIKIAVEGKDIPAELYIFIKDKNDVNYQKYALIKHSLVSYSYTFRNVHADFDYYIGNDVVGNEPVHVEVLGRPSLGSFFVVLNYPAYTALPAETLATNVGDFQALYGTRVDWHFTFKGPVDKATFIRDSLVMAIPLNPEDPTHAVFSQQVLKNGKYSIRLTSNRDVTNADTVQYNIQVVPDRNPSVAIREPQPEINLPMTGIIMLTADLSDDFGFSKAEFHYRFMKSLNPLKSGVDYKVVPLSGLTTGNVLALQQPVDLMGKNANGQIIGAEPGDQIEYFVKVWDNDVLSGPKSATSVVQKVNYLSTESLYDEQNQNSEQFSDNLDKMQSQSSSLDKEFSKMQKSLLDKKNLSYEDKEQIKRMLDKQMETLKSIEDAKQKLNEQKQDAAQNDLYSEDLLNKMQQLEKLLDALTAPEMKKYLDDLKRKIGDMDTRDLKKEMDKAQQSVEEMKENLERMLELFKQVQIQQKGEEISQKLQNMAERQDLLKERLEDARTEEERKAIEDKQNELNKQMQDLRKDLDKLGELKQQTQTPDTEKMNDLKKKGEQTQNNMDQAKQNLQKNNRKEAQKNQDQAKQQMDEMKEELDKMMEDQEEEQQKENYQDLRSLVENLIKLSFDQEELRNEMSKARQNDPVVKRLTLKQTKIQDDMRMIDDSLKLLVSRSFEIEKFVTDEVNRINASLKLTNEHLNNKSIQAATGEQHRVMTGLNNLSNMLVESLDKMQEKMKQKKGKGKGKPKPCMMPMNSMQQMSEMQKKLNDMLQKLMDGGKKDGNDGKELQEMAKKQEEIRKQLQQAYDKLAQDAKDGKGNKALLDKLASDMKLTEEQLKNKQLTEELMMRQRQILSRMLDYDKSFREREFEEKRRGFTAKQKNTTNPAELAPEELKERIRTEQFNRERYRYTPAYQQLIDNYYKILDKK